MNWDTLLGTTEFSAESMRILDQYPHALRAEKSARNPHGSDMFLSDSTRISVWKNQQWGGNRALYLVAVVQAL